MNRSKVDSPDPQLASLMGHSAVPEGIRAALGKPSGARFFKCALQVNPFAYTTRHAKKTAFKTEEEYNEAIVAACVKEGIEVVGITDHFRIATSQKLAAALEAAGIHVLLGFEASSSEGVHLLCLFPGSTSHSELERTIGACGVTDLTAESPQSDKTCEQLLQLIPKMGGITVAAHACSPSGLLTTLKGQPRARVWGNPDLLAIALPGPRASAPENCRDIIANKDPAHARPHLVAVINANDVSDPAALADPSTTSWIKMVVPSIEGLRQAFLDCDSRIRLNSDPAPTQHTELIAVSWAGGLLDGQSLRFNESLNALIGGRGAGKSTLIESLRYAFELPPKGDEAKRQHDSMIKSVLGQGATIAVLLRSPRPSPQYYLIERIYGSKARVRDQSGELLQNVKPQAVLGNLEVYGQHEISELTRFPEKLAQLLRRFTEPTADKSAAKAGLREELERSRTAVTTEETEIGRIEEALAALPALKEHLKRFAAAGLDEKLKDKTQIDKEGRLFEDAMEMVGKASELAAEVLAQGTADGPIVGDDAKELPNGVIVAKLDKVQKDLLQKITAAGKAIEAAVKEATKAVETIKVEWTPKQTAANELYQKTLKQLKAEGHDADKFVQYKNQVERLKPKETELKTRKKTLAELQKARRELLAKWDAAKAEDYRELQKAARKVSKRLKDRVRVSVRPSATLDQLETAIRKHCSGNFTQPLERLRAKDDLSLTDLGSAVAEGAATLVSRYGFSQNAAERMAQGGAALALEIEECEVPAEAVLELNVGSENAQTWKELAQLSTGQKATAVLLLLLLESDAPLIVDQPEDDLDNRFIADCIVPTMRDEKKKRQFIFSTHNANIPVLGDAEQIAGLTPVVESGVEHATIPDDLCGSIDTPAIKEMIKDLLEGGQEAFEFRRQKYGF
ncbi:MULTISPECIES: TrlF family AAA-like ATPase [unclassified Bradyrhizobium]|uniref:TrlF family AAA-like ATPase n=1 Tax=unclassified Bradyrhizobium TaxID=2631580 RepID=UPI002915E6F1|nr:MULTISPECIES: phosphoesterase [unclassified Bradyrhizobium]